MDGGDKQMIVRKSKESTFPLFQFKNELQKRKIPITQFAEAVGIRPAVFHGNRPFPDEKADECWKLLDAWHKKESSDYPSTTGGVRANAAQNI